MRRARRFAITLLVACVALTLPGGVKRVAAAQEARAEITKLFEALFDGRPWTEDKEDLLADEDELGPLMRRIKDENVERLRRGGIQIERQFFVSPTEAVVELRGPGFGGWSGFTAEVARGRWRLGIGTACELAGYGILTAKPRCFEKLSAAEARRRQMPRAPVVSWLGPHPDDPTRAADLIAATVQSLFARDARPEERAEFVQGRAREMASVIKDAQSVWEMDKSPSGPGFHWVDTVVFTSRTSADVAYRWVRRDPMSVRDVYRTIRKPATRPTLHMIVENGRWKVDRRSFCALHWSIAHWCPNGVPVPLPKELPAKAIEEKEGLPKDVPTFSVIDRTGSLWVLRDGEAKRWADAGPDPGNDGYTRARFGPDGALYAMRYVGKRVQIDRFDGPGEGRTVIDVPAFGYTYDREEGKIGDAGYEGTFGVSDVGISLIRVEKIADDECYDPENDGCAPQDGWFVELRSFLRLGRVGRIAPEPFDSRPFDAMWYISVEIDDESSDGRTMLVTTYPNKFWIHESVVRLPSLESDTCCEKSTRMHGPRGVMSPSGAEMLFKRTSDEATPFGRELEPELRAVGVKGESERVIMRWEPRKGGQLADVWEWTDGFVAFTHGHEEPYELYLLRLSDNTAFRTMLTFGGIKDVDFAMH